MELLTRQQFNNYQKFINEQLIIPTQYSLQYLSFYLINVSEQAKKEARSVMPLVPNKPMHLTERLKKIFGECIGVVSKICSVINQKLYKLLQNDGFIEGDLTIYVSNLNLEYYTNKVNMECFKLEIHEICKKLIHYIKEILDRLSIDMIEVLQKDMKKYQL